LAENFPEPITALGESLTFYEITDILQADTNILRLYIARYQ